MIDLQQLNGQHIGILGAGAEGLAALRFLHHACASASLTLLTNAAEVILPEDLPECLIDHQRLTSERLCEFDWIVRSPGFSPLRAPLKGLQGQPGAPRLTTGSNLWFARWPQARSIVVTGTKGKSTVASLIAAMLEHSGVSVRLAGNIGVALLEVEPTDWTVIELSSYQLSDFQATPSAAVLTNLYPEHLDWHGSYRHYLGDKLGWLRRMTGKPVFLPAGSPELLAELQTYCASNCEMIKANDPSRVLRLDGACLVHGDGKGAIRLLGPGDWPLAGSHNRLNSLLAMEVALWAGASQTGCLSALAGFSGLPHRFEVIAELDGWRFIDDSIATTPYATLAGLAALAEDEACVLLIGGQNRGIDWTAFYQALPELPLVALIGLGGGDNSNAKAILEGASRARPSLPCLLSSNMEQALALAKPYLNEHRSGAVLMSPGAPSYGQYRDFRHRGECFRQAVYSLASS